jgi:hypothetical protein
VTVRSVAAVEETEEASVVEALMLETSGSWRYPGGPGGVQKYWMNAG